MDHLWHMTAWGARPLAAKARDLTALIRRELEGVEHLEGVVITDGAVLMRPNLPEETVSLNEGAVAMSRKIDRWHTRESVVIPLTPLALEAAVLWRAIFDGESAWAIRELGALGLKPPSELVIP